MSDSEHEPITPEIDAILNDLAAMCVATIEADESFEDERAQKLVSSLQRNGWDRHAAKAKPLRDQVRDRVFEALPTHAHPRRSELDGLLARIQHLYKSVSLYESKIPAEEQPPGQDPRAQAAPPNTTLQGDK